jgi:glutamine amidotransferase
MNKKVTIIDYGVGNLLSLKRAFQAIDVDTIITNNTKKIVNSSYVILPGVGAFKNAMKFINQLGLLDAIKQIAKKGTPLLGICLGAQLLLDGSEEFGYTPGLKIIKGNVKSILDYRTHNKKIIIPHMGWANIYLKNNTSDIKKFFLKNINRDDSFYFVHSYVSKTTHIEDTHYITKYEGIEITAIHGKENIYGFQFHPEKSGKSGLKLLKNFLVI